MRNSSPFFGFLICVHPLFPLLRLVVILDLIIYPFPHVLKHISLRKDKQTCMLLSLTHACWIRSLLYDLQLNAPFLVTTCVGRNPYVSRRTTASTISGYKALNWKIRRSCYHTLHLHNTKHWFSVTAKPKMHPFSDGRLKTMLGSLILMHGKIAKSWTFTARRNIKSFKDCIILVLW